MIDIKYLREKPEEIKARIKKREMDLDTVVDEILVVDAQKREQMGRIEAMKAEQNAASKQIPQIKKAGGDASEIMAKMKELVAEIKEGDAKIAELDEKQKSLLLSLPVPLRAPALHFPSLLRMRPARTASPGTASWQERQTLFFSLFCPPLTFSFFLFHSV